MQSCTDPGTLGHWYDDSAPTSEEEVVALLSERAGAGERGVVIDAGTEVKLSGELTVPWGAYARGVIALAHGPGSTRPEPGNRMLATALNHAGFATLEVDLLSAPEQLGHSQTPNTDTLAARLIAATRWLRRQPETARVAVGYLGAAPAAEAVLLAAGRLRAGVCAIVLRGGPVDRPESRLGDVVAPVRLIVGAHDPEDRERVCRLAADWFTHHLSEAVPAPDRDHAAVV